MLFVYFMKQYDNIIKKFIDDRTFGFSFNKHIEMPAMFKLVNNIKNKKLLDLGCGFGAHAKHYSKKGARVTGIDSSKKEIEYAKQQNIRNTHFFVYDINKKLPFKDKEFDIITCSLVLDYIKNLNKIFQETYRTLKKQGFMIFSIPTPIFCQEEPIAGMLKKKNSRQIFGNYFKRRKIVHKWWGEFEITLYHKPLEDYFSAFLKAGFTLIEFKEPKPIPSSKKINPVKYKFTSRNPYFLLFKLQKK